MKTGDPPSPAASRNWLGPVCAWLAVAVPLVVTVLRLSPSTQWRDDLHVVRGLGLVPLGGEGVLSGLGMQLAALLPAGGRLLRAALVSAVGLGFCSRLLFAVARRVLVASGGSATLASLLSLAAALTATLTPTWQLEGTIAGGATVAAALCLLALLLRPRADARDARVWLGFGALVTLAALESHAAAVALVAALAVQMVTVGEAPPRRSLLLALLGGGAVLGVGLAPMLVRPLAPHAWVHLGYGLLGSGLSAVDTAAERPGAVAVWLGEVGVVSAAFAVAGVAWGILRPRLRWLVAPLLTLIAADLLFPASRAGVLASDPLTPVRLLAIGSLAVCAALGVNMAIVGLQRLRLPMARPATALLVVFNYTLVLLMVEDSSYVADRRAQRGAELWTDEALGALPPRALLLVRSEAVAWHLWAARLVRGERPDLLVAPLSLLDRGSVASRLLEAEPDLVHLIREVAINGTPSEYALSTLADTRPLYVELDPAWDQRLFEHLAPEPLWLRFAPHALGRSDRLPGLARSRAAFARVRRAVEPPQHRDRATQALLAARLREQVALLGTLGDWKSARPLLADLLAIDPDDPLAIEAKSAMDSGRRGGVELWARIQ